ncbi:hypothetical protein JCM8202_004106 [Rhodotorula sphaerocarpa]
MSQPGESGPAPRRALRQIQVREDRAEGAHHNRGHGANGQDNLVSKMRRLKSQLADTIAERDRLNLELLARSLDSKAHAQAQHELELLDLRGENAVLRSKLDKAFAELDEARAEQAEQQEACASLMLEQERLEVAYDEALDELDHLRRYVPAEEGIETEPSVPQPEQKPRGRFQEQLEPEQEEALPDLSWEILPSDLPSTRRKSEKLTKRFMGKRNRARPSNPQQPADAEPRDAATVRNDVEQLKKQVLCLRRLLCSYESER